MEKRAVIEEGTTVPEEKFDKKAELKNKDILISKLETDAVKRASDSFEDKLKER